MRHQTYVDPDRKFRRTRFVELNPINLGCEHSVGRQWGCSFLVRVKIK